MNKFVRTAVVVMLLATLVASVAVAQSGARGATRTVRYTLRVLSNVPNSRVFINAVAQSGTTPLEVDLNAGQYDIVVRAPGYLDYTTKINLSRDLTVNARLQPASYQLTVTASVPNAAVYINGSNRGNAPVSLMLQMGVYDLSVRAAGYEEYSASVNLNRNLNVSASLKPIIYNVSIGSNVKGATVYVDGNARGSVPVTIPLQTGVHTIRISAPGYLDVEQRLNVQRDTNVNATLQPAFAHVSVSISPDYLNPLVKEPLSLFRIYVDETPITTEELRRMRFRLRPGRRKIWVVTGGILIESTFMIAPGKDYILRFGLELTLIEPEAER